MGTSRKIFRGARNHSHLNETLRVFATFKTKLNGVYCERHRHERIFKGDFETAEYDVNFLIPRKWVASALDHKLCQNNLNEIIAFKLGLKPYNKNSNFEILGKT